MSIRCSQGHENPDGSAFCDECGEPLNSDAPVSTAAPVVSAPDPAIVNGADTSAAAGTQVCPSCGAVNPAGEAFCSNCGVSLLGGASAASAPAAPVADASSAPAVQPDDQAVAASPSPVATAAPAALQARLIVEADNQEFDLSGKNDITIGREDAVSNIYPDVDLTPHGGEEGGVSRLHARIFVENGQYMLEDENSTNFTFLNRQRLTAKTPTPLNDNDEVRLGRVLLRFKTS
jgi:hypothetical protein